MSESTGSGQTQSTQSAGWLSDPTGRHESRYWDGMAWTRHVADNGVVSVEDDGTPIEPLEIPEFKECPECFSQIDGRASVCPNCNERIMGSRCPACLAMNSEGARLCRWCGTKLATASATRKLSAFTIKADAIGALLINHSFHPQVAAFTQDKIVITTYGFFGLTSSDEEIPWEKVAGFKHHSGLIWDQVQIETRGQSSAVISCLSRQDGERIKQVMQGLEQ